MPSFGWEPKHSYRSRFRREAHAALWSTPSVVVLALVVGVAVMLAPTPAVAADTSPPSQPGAISVSNVKAASASLAWGSSTDNIRIEGYRVYRRPAGVANTSLSLIATTDAVASYAAANLHAGYAYKFGVVAIDAADNASPMTTTKFTTLTSSDATAPAAPSSTSVSLKAFSASRIDIVWGASASTDVAYYKAYRDGSLVGTVERPNSQRYSDNGLAASTTHSYTIKAVDSAGNSSTPTSAKSASTTATGVVKIARGPYLSNVTGKSALGTKGALLRGAGGRGHLDLELGGTP